MKILVSLGLKYLALKLDLPSLKLTAKAPENGPKPKRQLVFQPSIFQWIC